MWTGPPQVGESELPRSRVGGSTAEITGAQTLTRRYTVDFLAQRATIRNLKSVL